MFIGFNKYGFKCSLKERSEQWKKEKKLPVGVTTLVSNTILTRANIKALMLSQEVDLPPQIYLPKVSPADQGESKKGDYIG